MDSAFFSMFLTALSPFSSVRKVKKKKNREKEKDRERRKLEAQMRHYFRMDYFD